MLVEAVNVFNHAIPNNKKRPSWFLLAESYILFVVLVVFTSVFNIIIITNSIISVMFIIIGISLIALFFLLLALFLFIFPIF